MAIVEFFGLLLIIVFAAYLLSRGAEALAAKWGVNIVGSVLLALVTTLPEYAFVYWASVKGEYEVAIGSAIGSCTLLITLGYGLVILLATSRFSRKPVERITLSKATRVDAVYLLVTGIVAFVLISWDNALSFVDGIVLTILFGGYVYHVFKAGKSCAHERAHSLPRKVLVRALCELVVGAVVVYAVAEPFVDSMIHVAELLRISPVVIAIVLAPLASEMPEKLTAYMVVMKNGANAELSICNFLGSKVNHNSLLLAVMPFVAHSKGHDTVRNLMSVNLIVMTVLTVVVSALLARGRLQRSQGVWLVAAYVIAMVLAVVTH